MRPRIGITTYARAGEPRPSFSVPCGYVEAIEAAGGVAVLLPPVRAPAELLGTIDGLLLPGGGDIGPERYGGAPHHEHYDVSAERDAFEIELVQGALERSGFPLVCICRGMQVLNVVLGGDVVAHLPDTVGETVPHRKPGLMPVPHEVTLGEQCRLHAIHGHTRLQVQSIHHQAVDRLGRGLTAVGWSEDGVVEAVESDAHDFVLGVQWHPELDPPAATSRRLFDALVARSRS